MGDTVGSSHRGAFGGPGFLVSGFGSGLPNICQTTAKYFLEAGINQQSTSTATSPCKKR